MVEGAQILTEEEADQLMQLQHEHEQQQQEQEIEQEILQEVQEVRPVVCTRQGKANAKAKENRKTLSITSYHSTYLSLSWFSAEASHASFIVDNCNGDFHCDFMDS